MVQVHKHYLVLVQLQITLPQIHKLSFSLIQKLNHNIVQQRSAILTFTFPNSSGTDELTINLIGSGTGGDPEGPPPEP